MGDFNAWVLLGPLAGILIGLWWRDSRLRAQRDFDRAYKLREAKEAEVREAVRRDFDRGGDWTFIHDESLCPEARKAVAGDLLKVHEDLARAWALSDKRNPHPASDSLEDARPSRPTQRGEGSTPSTGLEAGCAKNFEDFVGADGGQEL